MQLHYYLNLEPLYRPFSSSLFDFTNFYKVFFFKQTIFVAFLFIILTVIPLDFKLRTKIHLYAFLEPKTNLEKVMLLSFIREFLKNSES